MRGVRHKNYKTCDAWEYIGHDPRKVSATRGEREHLKCVANKTPEHLEQVRQ